MNKDFSALKPALVWKHFEAICQIPHPSHHEEKIRQYIIDFAESHALPYEVDTANNIVIRKAATPGMEQRCGVVLQAHLDMVPQKNNDKEFDFLTDPIEAYIDGEWVTANGTTLGADNGIGVAATLAVLEDDTLKHGPIEGLFTATEETGMDGAFGLQSGVLQGDILLNLDSETYGELYVGCAGGLDANIQLPYASEPAPSGYKTFSLELKGLKGGHSGIQIICQRANANRELFRLLNHTSLDVRLASIDGGGLRNAIPREAVAVVMVADADCDSFLAEVAAFERLLVAEYQNIEDSISLQAIPVAQPESVMTAESAARLAKMVIGLPNGVIKMSVEMEGLVETSSNLARVVSDGESVKVQCLLRGSVNSEKLALGEALKGVAELAGASVVLSGDYDGWKPNMSSPILHTMKEIYKSLYGGEEPAVMAIHAGLECGIIGGKYPEMDMISFGPTIQSPHSPDERVEIASVEKFYHFLTYTLEQIPSK